ncbi:hypothetical protein LXA43DRAFT_55644 [Ganoderma leucocontextum]|nr:hypothetical protein LXA43DRAFT_55644 [Ganoderma leucocontextum]
MRPPSRRCPSCSALRFAVLVSQLHLAPHKLVTPKTMTVTATGTQSPDPLYTINATTVIGIVNDTEELHNAAYQLQGRLLGTLISSCLFGTFALCTCIAVVLNSRKIRTARRAIWYTLAMITMFASTSIYWAFIIRNTFTIAGTTASTSDDIGRAWELQFLAHDPACGGDEATLTICHPDVLGRLSDPDFTYEYCVGTAALTTNISIGDAIVWSRVCVLWPRHRFIRLIFALLLLGTVCTSIVSTVHSCQGLLVHGAVPTFPLDPESQVIVGIRNGIGPSAGNIVGAFFEGDPFGIAASVLSFTSNVISTCLVGFQAWKHRALVRGDGLRSFLGRSQVSRAFMLLIESGACYSVIWAFVVTYQLISTPWYSHALSSSTRPSPALSAFATGAESFTEGGLVILVAIYPTVIMLLVALNRSECDTIVSYRGDGQAAVVPSLVFRGSVLQSVSSPQAGNGLSAGDRASSTVSSSADDVDCSYGPGDLPEP